MNNHNPLPIKQKPVVSPRIPFNEPQASFETDTERIKRFKRHTRKLVLIYLSFGLVFGFAIGCYIGLWQGVKAPHGLNEARLLEENKQLKLDLSNAKSMYQTCLDSRFGVEVAVSKM